MQYDKESTTDRLEAWRMDLLIKRMKNDGHFLLDRRRESKQKPKSN